MKKNLIKILVSASLINFLSCTSVPVNKGQIQNRERLTKEEQWRFETPNTDNPAVAPVFPKVKSHVLKNGLTIRVMEDHRLPIAQVRLVFKNGSAADPVGQAGLQNLTALMLKEGTKELNSLELAEAFANLGTEVSVAVAKDTAHLYADVLSNKVDDAMKLFAAMVQEPRLEQTDFIRVKTQQQNAIASDTAEPSYAAQVSFLMAAYGPKHPYAYPSKGNLKTISKIDLAQIKQAHRQNFGPNNAALVIAGDVKMAEIIKLSNKIFGKWKKIKNNVAKVSLPPTRKQMETRLVSRPHTPQTYLLLGQPVASAKDKDLPILEVFQQILAGTPQSRLDNNLREKKGWTYGVSSSINPLLGVGPMMVSTSIQVPFGSDAVQEMLAEFENLKTNPVTDLELKAAKEGLLHSFASRFNTVEKIAATMANYFAYNLEANYDERFYQKIGETTKDDIMAAAQRVFNRSGMVAVAVGELEVMQIPLAKIDVGRITVEREGTEN